MSSLPLPRPTSRNTCSGTYAFAGRDGALRRAMDAQGFLRGRDAAALGPDARRLARVRRGPHVCNPGEFYVLPQSPQDRQATLDGGGFDRLLPDRAMHARRGPAGRSPISSSPNSISKRASSIKMTSSASSRSRCWDAAEAATGVRPTTSVDDVGPRPWTATAPTSRTFVSRCCSTTCPTSRVTEVKAFSAPTVKAMRVAAGRALARPTGRS